MEQSHACRLHSPTCFTLKISVRQQNETHYYLDCNDRSQGLNIVGNILDDEIIFRHFILEILRILSLSLSQRASQRKSQMKLNVLDDFSKCTAALCVHIIHRSFAQ